MAQNKPASLVICDAGPLIHLDELGCLDLLADFPKVCVPSAVWRELQRHRPPALRRRTVVLSCNDQIPEPTEELALLVQTFELHAGEEEALRLCQQFPDALFLTDDISARFVATQLGFQVHGTIGVIVRAIRRRQKSKRQVLNLLRAIPDRSTLFIERKLLQTVIEQVEQSS